jgi:hypothetical protein
MIKTNTYRGQADRELRALLCALARYGSYSHFGCLGPFPLRSPRPLR